MGLGGAKRSRSPSDASPVAFCLLCRHGQSRSPPAGGEIPQREIVENRSGAPRSWPRPASLAPAGQFTFSRPTKAFRNSPPHPSGLTASHLSLSLCRFATSPLDKGSRPPGGRLSGGHTGPPLRRKGRFSGGEDTAPTGKRRLWGASVGHSGVPKWAGFPPPPASCAPLAHNFFKKGHPGPPGGAGSGWPLKKR